MKVRAFGWIGLLLMMRVVLSSADVPESIPDSFPIDQQPAFVKEKQALLAEGKKLDARRVKHNKTCSAPDPYHAEKCSQERLVLYKQLDDYQKKVKDFNRRLAAVDTYTGKKIQTDE